MKKILLIFLLIFSTSKLFSQNVNIPDTNFKSYLVGNSGINTNFDAEIQVAEASAFSGRINISSSGVSDLTGLEAFTALTSFNCSYNSITSLNLSFLNTLLTLECNNNSLSTLDLSFLSNLDTLACQNNPLTFLNVANGNNTNITYFNALPNTSLTCIKVDDAAYSTATWTLVDGASTFISKVDNPTNVTMCATYTLPSLSVGDYFTGSGGSGTALFSGNVITSTQTIYVYKANGSCFDESSFLVTINPLPSVDAGTNQTICENTSLTLNGAGAVSYAWDNGVTDGVSFTPNVGTTTFVVTGTDANGCFVNDTVFVTVNPLPTVDAGTNQTVCENTSITLNGAGAVSYAWNNGVTDGVSFTPNVGTTTFVVTGTDANGCFVNDTVFVTVNPLPIVDAGLDQTVCFAGNVTLNGSGANSYSWDNGVSDGVIFNPTSSANYVLTGVDLNACSNTDTLIVTVLALPSVNAGTDQIVCENQNITLAGSGAQTYSWDFSVIDGVPFTHFPGLFTFTVTGTDVNGCVNTDQVDVLVNALPGVFAGSDIIACQNDSITLTGSGANTYSWDNSILDNTPFTKPNGTITFTVTGTDANGCVNTDQVDVTFNALPNINAGVDQTVCENDLITLVCSGVISLAWDNGVFDNTPFIQAVGSTVYTVNGSDANGCSSSDQVSVTVIALPIVNAGIDQTVCEFDNIVISASGASTYSWDNGVFDSIPFTQGVGVITYTVTGTANGCSSNDQLDITVNALPSVNAGLDQTLCENTNVTLAGSGAGSYAWDNGVTDNIAFTQVVGTITYTLTGTDGNGCINTDQVDVIVNANPIANAGADQFVCENDIIVLSGSGASTLTWDNSVTNGVSFTQVVGTVTYTLMATDANGCSSLDQVDITVNALPAVDAGPDFESCENATISLSGNGAQAYTWDNSVVDGVAFIPNVGITTFIVTGTDINACFNNDTIMVTVNLLPTINVNTTLEICENDEIALSANSSSPFIFWFDQATGGNVISQSGDYSSNEIVSDSIIFVEAIENGCSSARTAVQITVNSKPVIALSSTNSDCGLNNGSASAVISQGTLPYSNFYWSNGEQNVLNIANLPTGSYYFNVEDVKGCKAIAVTEVIPNSISITPTLVDPACNGQASGSIALNIAGTSETLSYYWSTGHQSQNVSNLKAGTYEVTVTTASNCSFTSSFVLTDLDPIANLVNELKPSCGNSDGSLEVISTSGGQAGYTYSWTNGVNGTQNMNIGFGVYTLTTTDNNGCQHMKTYYLSESNAPSIVGTISETDCSMNNGAINVDLTPQIGDTISMVSWSNGAFTEDISSLATGSYICTAKASNNCSAIKGWNLNVKKPDLQEICIVSVDSVTTTNLVIWEKVQTTGISHYNIYRESNQIDEYQLIDTVQFTNLSVFNDVVASPNARSWRYRISAVDMCGVEGNLSAAHKTLHLNSFDLGGTGVKITWDQYEGTAFSSYDVSRYTDANGWEIIASLPTSDLNYTDTASITTPGLDYMVEISLDEPCTATTWRAQDFNRSRSNKERGIFSPGEGTGEFSNNEIFELTAGNLSLNIYPNPFENELFLNLNGLEDLNIKITNINGIEVTNQLCKAGTNIINLENLTDGLYFIVFENQLNLEAIKIVKK